MTIAYYFPTPGFDVPFPTEHDPPLGSAGASAQVSDYLTNEVLAGHLLTYDPSGEPFEPIVTINLAGDVTGQSNANTVVRLRNASIPVLSNGALTSTSGVLSWSPAAVLSVATLATTPGTADGQVVTVRGFTTVNDGGQGDFYWVAGGVATAVPGMIVNATGGQWQRLIDKATYNVRWFGAFGNNVSNDTGALQTCLDYCVPRGGVILFPPGTYKITSPLYAKGWASGNTSSTIRGSNAPGAWVVTNTVIMWDGVSYDGTVGTKQPALWIEGSDIVVENIAFKTTSGKKLYSGIECGPFTASGKVLSRNQFRGVTVYALTADSIENGVSVASVNTQSDYMEDMLFDHCTFHNLNVGILLATGRPFNTVVRRCIFQNIIAGAPRGTGIRSNIAFASIQTQNCQFRALEMCAQMPAGYANLSFMGGESTGCKKLLHAAATRVGQPGSLAVQSMQLSPAQVAASTVNFGPSDKNFIYDYSGNSILLKGNSFVDSTSTITQWKIAFPSSTRVVSSNNAYPNDYVWGPFVDFRNTSVGGVFSHGDRYADGVAPELVNLPRLEGSFNVSGLVTLSGSQTSLSVPLPFSEFLTDYKIRLDLETAVLPTPGALAAWSSNKTMSSWWINLAVAPGTSDSVTYRWTIYR